MTFETTIQPLIACATCLSDRGSQTYTAANSAIFLMLGCLVLVLASLAAFVIHLARGGQKKLDTNQEG